VNLERKSKGKRDDEDEILFQIKTSQVQQETHKRDNMSRNNLER
jgi:hypothetical protein